MAWTNNVVTQELLNTAEEQFDLQSGVTARVQLQCVWRDRWRAAEELLTTSSKYQKPRNSNSDSPEAVAVSISGLGCEVASPSNPTEIEYELAQLSVQYSNEVKFDDEFNCKVIETLSPSVQTQKSTWFGLVWDSSGSDRTVAPNETPVKEHTDWVLTRIMFFRDIVPDVYIEGAGKINENEYISDILGLTFPAKSMLFQPGDLERSVGVSPTLETKFTLNNRFKIRFSGWNKFWDTISQEFREIFVFQDTGNVLFEPYETDPFTDILKQPAPPP